LLCEKKNPQKEVIMTKSSNLKQQGVKRFTPKQRERLLEILEPLELKNVITDGINDYIGSGTRLMLELLLHAEAEKLCGKWHEHDQERLFVRWGNEKGKALIDGAKREIERPRVRVARNLSESGGEVQLEMYKVMNSNELLDNALVATILAGVSARKYQSILARGLEAKGVSKSTVSRKAIAKTKPMVDEFRQSRLDKQDFVVLLFDGIHVARKQMIACVGIDMNGRKHVLGLRVGATENDIVCRDLIREMKERGLPSDKKYLFVIDGSKALANTIRAAFGQEVAIQRCQEHKIRDVQGYLPKKMRAETRKKIQAAYNQTSEKAAWKRLDKIRSELANISENAVNSLTEGLYETLTVHRLGITGLLRKSLRTTNIMESAFSSVRRYMGRVSRFRDEAQIELWITRSILEAERHFRTLRGCRHLRKLRENLDAYRGGSHHA
jgi:transposase-like protein